MMKMRHDLVGNKTRVQRFAVSPHLAEALATWGKREGFVVPSGRSKGVRERQARARDIAAAWKRAGVPEEKWKGQPDQAFRKGVKTGLLLLNQHRDAIDYVQGHIDAAGARPLHRTRRSSR